MTSTATDHHSHGPIRISDADALRARVRAAALEPVDPGRDETRQAFNTRLDQRPPAHVVSNTLTIAVDAPLEVTRRAHHAAPLAGPAVRALRELGLDDRVELRPEGLSWRHPGTNGSVEVDVQIDTADNGEGGTWLTITTRFSATDDDARVRLLDAWALVGPLASSLADRAARAIRQRAEGCDPDDIAPAALAS